MRIVHFSAGRINPFKAKVGSVNVIYWLAYEQARLGHDVKVVVVPAKRDYENLVVDEFEIHEYPAASLKGFKLPQSLVEDISSGELAMDVAHLHGVYVPEMIAVAKILRKFNIPYVISTHGSLSPYILKKGDVMAKWIFKWLFVHRYLNSAAFIHLHCEGEKNDAKWYGVKVPTVVGEHGFDWESMPSELNPNWLHEWFPETKRKLKFLFLGRLDPWHKGIDILIEGFSKALRQHRDMVLFLVGPEKKRYRGVIPKLIQKFGVMDAVITVGPLYDPLDKFSAIASSDVFVLTSRYEGFPLTLYEAWACGKPVVVTPGTNAADWVRSNGLGWICEPNSDAIAKALINIYDNRRSITDKGAKAREFVKKFTWRRTAEILVVKYREVLNNAGR